MSDEEVMVFQCSDIGVSGTTPVHVKRMSDGTFIARMGIAIMGVTNMDEGGFDACDHNPFHPEFYDNYVSGNGITEEEAIMDMKIDMRKMADSLWAI